MKILTLEKTKGSTATAVILVIMAVILALGFVEAATDPMDLRSLQVIYTSLNSPSKLTGWKANGGDPCRELWRGVACQGSSVVSIDISGLGLNGTMGYMLDGLKSLKTLDMSGNNIHGSIPYQLPLDLTNLNLASNHLSGSIPYSIIDMVSINYLNLSRNSLHQSVGDVFTNHSDLATLDLSFNNFSGDLPPSIGSLSNLAILYLQGNQLSGTLDVLVDLHLIDLNVANNNFSGLVPYEMISIPNFIYDGNSFDNIGSDNNDTDPPPPFFPPSPHPPSGSDINDTHHFPPDLHKAQGSDGARPSNLENRNRKKSLTSGDIIGIVLGSSLVVLLAISALIICIRKCKGKENATRASTVNRKVLEPRANLASTVVDLKPLPMERMTLDIVQGRKGSVMSANSTITATPFTVAALQNATNSFCQENLVGEGSVGCVYRADFPNGNVIFFFSYNPSVPN
ncbi:unnamed protein product [Cuscuta campestris]|uniref:Leucine-rich repeat-containing N-terminal plant-type domain-containing protein n=1 Tax=Cuscuta campestris TaxID=132261 RepID=A0A484MKN9_9ASTE|nr:unnamed protein product [Cuscuta campestris]